MAGVIPQYYIFVKPYTVGGTTIHPGVSLKGEFEVTDTHISQKGSTLLSNIPKEYLEPYTPHKFEKKVRKKK
jgi:hypothetical protein